MIKYSNIKCVIFDMGSTLIEFETRPWDAITDEGQMLAFDRLIDEGVNLPEFDVFTKRLDEIKNNFRKIAIRDSKEWLIIDAFEIVLKEFDVDDTIRLSKIYSETFYSAVRKGIVLLDGVLETLESLQSRGMKLGLISNTIFPRYEHEKDLQDFGIRKYLDYRLYSSEIGIRKPKPEIFEKALRFFGLPPEQTVYVGDRYLEDVTGPQKVGMNPILICSKIREYPDPMPDGFPVINKIPQLLDHIE